MNISSLPQGRNLHMPLWGWGISILLHALALAWLVRNPPVQPAPEQPQRRSTLVMVQLQRPAPATTERTAAADTHGTSARAAKSVRPVRRVQSLPRLPVPSTAVVSVDTSAPPATTVDEAPSAGAAAGAEAGAVFDMEAARMAIRTGAGRDGKARERESPAAGALEATRDEKLGKAIERSRRSDCQTQYAGMGLLAVIPLVKDTVTGTGCKWN